jgi:hypothetical protein
MKRLPLTGELLALAPHVIWFEPPEQALRDPVRFLAHLLTYGTPAEIAVVRRYLGPEDFREALENAPPGIFDARSWAYWNIVVGREPVPPMPQRRYGEDSC